MNQLEPCPACQRHVRSVASSCPFCSAELEPGEAKRQAPSGRRLGRFAAFTFQSGLMATALGCSDGGLVTASGGQTGSGGAASGGATSSGGAASGGATSSGGQTGSGGSELGGAGGLGGAPGSGGDDVGVPIYSAVPWNGSER